MFYLHSSAPLSHCVFPACEYCLRALETAEENARRLSGIPGLTLPHPELCRVRPELHQACPQCQVSQSGCVHAWIYLMLVFKGLKLKKKNVRVDICFSQKEKALKKLSDEFTQIHTKCCTTTIFETTYYSMTLFDIF